MMLSAIFGILGAALPKLVEQAQKLWEQYGEKWLIYRKGASDQHKKDKIHQQEREADESRRAMERVNEIQQKAQDRRGEPADGSDIFGRVRDTREGGDRK